MIASEAGNAEIVRELLAAGADVNITNKVNKTALTIANYERIERRLYVQVHGLDYGEHGLDKVVELLIQAGAV